MFTYDYWCSEVRVFRENIVLDKPDQAQVLLLRGLCYLAGMTIREANDRRKEVNDEFVACYRLAVQIKGQPWVNKHIEVFSTHGPIPPMPT